MADEYLQLPDGSYTKFTPGLDEAGKADFASKAFNAFYQQFPQQAIQSVPGLGQVHLDPSLSPDEQNLIRQKLGMQQQQATQAPAKPSTPMDLIKRAGQTAGAVGLPVAGGMLGGAAGAASPVPGGAVAGEMMGSGLGEYAAQKLGFSPESNLQIGLAAGSPLIGRALAATRAALPIARSKVISTVDKMTPTGKDASAALFRQLPNAPITASPAMVAAADDATRLSKIVGDKGLTDTLSKLKKPNLSFQEADTLKNDLQGYVNYYSKGGATSANYNPALARAIGQGKQALLDGLETTNPGYQQALSAAGAENNVGRLKAFISEQNDPGKKLAELRMKPLSDLKPKEKLMISSFDPQTLDEIQSLLERVPQADWKSIILSKAGGAVVGGAFGGAAGYHEGGGSGAAKGALAGVATMLAYPIGRRMLSEMIKSGAINNPSSMAAAVQLVRAVGGHLRTSSQDQ